MIELPLFELEAGISIAPVIEDGYLDRIRPCRYQASFVVLYCHVAGTPTCEIRTVFEEDCTV